MPSTPPEAAASSRDVTVASGECRQNAIKSRRENDWFGHDATVASASAGSRSTVSGLSAGGNDNRARSAAAGPRTPNKTARESEEWFRYDVSTSASSNGTGTPTSGSGPEVTKVRVQHGTQQDWYKHGADVPDPPSLDQQRSKTRSRRSACAEVRHKTTDPNEWFRHDHARGGSQGRIPEGSTRPAKKPAKVASPTSLWVVYPEDGSSPAELASTPRTRSHEADDYYRRDKVGSSADWFSHEHAHDETSGSGGQAPPPRMRGTPEGGEIASRLKGESEDWFSHDGNQNYVSPLPVGKGHSPLSKELMDRAQGSEIRQIFQMEEKLRATWNAPPPLLGPPEVSGVVQQSPTSVSSSAAQEDAVESVRATMDNMLLSNGQKNNNNNDATMAGTTPPH